MSSNIFFSALSFSSFTTHSKMDVDCCLIEIVNMKFQNVSLKASKFVVSVHFHFKIFNPLQNKATEWQDKSLKGDELRRTIKTINIHFATNLVHNNFLGCFAKPDFQIGESPFRVGFTLESWIRSSQTKSHYATKTVKSRQAKVKLFLAWKVV